MSARLGYARAGGGGAGAGKSYASSPSDDLRYYSPQRPSVPTSAGNDTTPTPDRAGSAEKTEASLKPTRHHTRTAATGAGAGATASTTPRLSQRLASISASPSPARSSARLPSSLRESSVSVGRVGASPVGVSAAAGGVGSSPLTDSAIRRVVQLEQTLAAIQIDNEELRVKLTEHERKHEEDLRLIHELRDVSVAASVRSTHASRELDTAMDTMRSLKSELLKAQTDRQVDLIEREDTEKVHSEQASFAAEVSESLRISEGSCSVAEKALETILGWHRGLAEQSGQLRQTVEVLQAMLEKEGVARQSAEAQAASRESRVAVLQAELAEQGEVGRSLQYQLAEFRHQRRSSLSSSTSEKGPSSPTCTEKASVFALANSQGSKLPSGASLITLQQIARAATSALEDSKMQVLYEDHVHRAVEQLSNVLLAKDGRGRSERIVETVIDSVTIVCKELRTMVKDKGEVSCSTAPQDVAAGEVLLQEAREAAAAAAREAEALRQRVRALEEKALSVSDNSSNVLEQSGAGDPVAEMQVQLVTLQQQLAEAQCEKNQAQVLRERVVDLEAKLEAASAGETAAQQEVARLTRSVEELQAHSPDSQEADALRARVKELEEAAAVQEESGTALTLRVRQLEAQLLDASCHEENSPTRQMQLLNEKISDLQSEIELGALKQEAATEKEATLVRQLQELEDRYVQRVTEIEGELQESRQRQKVELHAEALTDKVSELQSQVELAALREEESSARIQDLEKVLESQDASASESDSVTALQNRIATLEAQLAKQDDESGSDVDNNCTAKHQVTLEDALGQRDQAERAAELLLAEVEAAQDAARRLPEIVEQRDQAERIACQLQAELSDSTQSSSTVIKTLREQVAQLSSDNEDLRGQRNQAEREALLIHEASTQQ